MPLVNIEIQNGFEIFIGISLKMKMIHSVIIYFH